MKNLLYILFLSFPFLSFGQTGDQSTIFPSAQPGAEQKVTINVSNHSPNDVGALKDKLLGYQEKVLMVHYDESQNSLTIIYNEFMEVETLIGEFTKTGFKDVLNPVSKSLNETE